MKQLSFFFLLFIGLNTAKAQSKDIDKKQVPKAVTENFIRENPAITPSWKMDGKNYKAFYVDPKTNQGNMIEYDNKGTVLHRENAIDKDLNNVAAPEAK